MFFAIVGLFVCLLFSFVLFVTTTSCGTENNHKGGNDDDDDDDDDDKDDDDGANRNLFILHCYIEFTLQ